MQQPVAWLHNVVMEMVKRDMEGSGVAYNMKDFK